jgi:solute carrier family 10 (sodium/bile acid cotransporter), member 7
MFLMSFLKMLVPDSFILVLVATVGLASVLPCQGWAADGFHLLTGLAITLLFFLHGARLPREVVVAGVLHWRLHLTIFACTFLLFPLIGLAIRPLLAGILPPDMVTGVLFLCVLPSTVQSAIALTSLAGGNVAAAMCSASISSLLGMVLTPLLAGGFLKASGHVSAEGLSMIVMQLLLPFLLGQALHRRIGGWAQKHKKVLGLTDRGAILLMVYTVFSKASLDGVWAAVGPLDFGILAGICLALLGIVLVVSSIAARALGFSREDQIAIMFCGSKKSMVTGVPMANVIFAGHALGLIILPLMLFHQIQLIVCAMLAGRFARDLKRGV